MSASALLEAAEGHLAAGREAAAEQLFSEALEHPSAVAQGLSGLGRLALRAGDAARAETLFAQALKQRPDDPGHLAEMALVHQALERLDEAQACLDRALRLHPEHVGALIQSGLLRLVRGEVQAALEALGRALQANPRSVDAWLTVAAVEQSRGNLDGAHEAFAQAAALAPDRMDPWLGLGGLHQAIGDHAGALEHYEAARLVAPDDPQLLARMAQSTQASGNVEAAGKHLLQAVAMAPADPVVRLAEGAVRMDAGQFQEAVEAFQVAAQEDPDNPLPLLSLGTLMRRAGHLEAALEATRQSVELGGGDVAQRQEVELLFELGQWPMAWRQDGQPSGLTDDGESGSGDRRPKLEDLADQVALLVEDLPSALFSLRTLPPLAEGRHLRLVCLPEHARFFRALPQLAEVEAREVLSLQHQSRPAESLLLLDDLARLIRPEAEDLRDEDASLDISLTATPKSTARIGLWWRGDSNGIPLKTLLDALPQPVGLLRELEAAPDWQDESPTVLARASKDDLATLAETLLGLDWVVAEDGFVAHLAANLGKPTLVIGDYDLPWYWRACGESGVRWYPAARGVARDPDGGWEGILAACRDLPGAFARNVEPSASAGAETASNGGPLPSNPNA